MQRDITQKLALQHPDQADHLFTAFQRCWMRYQPSSDSGGEFLIAKPKSLDSEA
jgi:hypothetical protein